MRKTYESAAGFAVYGKGDFMTHPNNRKPVGCGPYKFVRWETNKEIELARREDYWDPKPSFSKIIFKIIPDESVRQGESTPPCGVPAVLGVTALSCITPARSIARRSLRTWRSLIRSSTAAINPECGIASKQLAMSDSATHRLPVHASSTRIWSASCAERLGRNPNEHSSMSASKIGSITVFVAA